MRHARHSMVDMMRSCPKCSGTRALEPHCRMDAPRQYESKCRWFRCVSCSVTFDTRNGRYFEAHAA